MTPSQPTLTASDLGGFARQLISSTPHSTEGVWPVAVAILGRQAIEVALSQLGAVRAPGLERASIRAQLICLQDQIDRDLARETSSVWAALSNACHHHAYALQPTASELESWLSIVDRFVTECDRILAIRAANASAHARLKED